MIPNNESNCGFRITVTWWEETRDESNKLMGLPSVLLFTAIIIIVK
jgi:hypothetical protein